VFAALDVEPVVFAEEFECIALAGELEPDSADLAGTLAPALEIPLLGQLTAVTTAAGYGWVTTATPE
jgi:hypothetical protein